MDKRKAFQNFSLIIASAILIFLVIEIVMRISYGIPASEISDFDLKRSHYYQKDDELWWVPGKNIHGEHNKKGSFTSTFQTNSRGLRDKEYALNKPEGVKRIVVVGDSFTWGFGVNDNEIYTERLESMLSRTEVINLGVTAYQLSNELRYFKREGTLYKPDILIVGLCLNDFMHGKVKSASEKDKSNIEGDVIKARGPQVKTSLNKNYLKEYFFRKSAFLTFIMDRVNTNRSIIKVLTYTGLKELAGFESLDWNLMPALRDYPDYLDKCWEETKTEILQFKRLTSDSGIRLIVAVVPSAQSIQEISFRHTISHSTFEEEDFDLDKPYMMLKDFAAANNIEMIIPVNTFRDINKKGQPLYLTRDMHFNAAGHDLFAHVIADYLSENK